MNFNDETTANLNAPLPADAIRDRTQQGTKLSYVEGWWVIDRMNQVFGHGCWERETTELKLLDSGLRKSRSGKENEVASYYAKVRVRVWTGHAWLVREGCGCGHGYAGSPGDAHESAIKEAETDAMKRAMMTFGYQFGLALYDKQKQHVEATPAQRVVPANNGQNGQTGTLAWLANYLNACGCPAGEVKEVAGKLKAILFPDVEGKLSAEQIKTLCEAVRRWGDKKEGVTWGKGSIGEIAEEFLPI